MIWGLILAGVVVGFLVLDHILGKRPITDEMRQNSIERRKRQDEAWAKAMEEYKKSRQPEG